MNFFLIKSNAGRDGEGEVGKKVIWLGIESDHQDQTKC